MCAHTHMITNDLVVDALTKEVESSLCSARTTMR